jgi:hypothetical protein
MKNNIVTIILVIIIGMVAFWYLGNNNNNNTGSSLSLSTQTSDSADAKYIYNILQQMAQVTLEDSIFKDPIFQNLKDNTASFPSQAAGRNNPFAPTGTDLSVPAATTTAKTN